MATTIADHIGPAPLVLTVPGLFNSGPGHWQTLWDEQRADCHRVDLGLWDRPHRNSWVNQLNLAIRAAHASGQGNRPVVLAAHSLGVITVVWWAQMERDAAHLVQGALLVAPPEVDFFPRDPRVGSFAPVPTAPLPFPAIVAASRNDPWIGQHAARRLARGWGARFEDMGEAGHINADSGLGAWPQGQRWIEELTAQSSAQPSVQSPPQVPAHPLDEDPARRDAAGAPPASRA